MTVLELAKVGHPTTLAGRDTGRIRFTVGGPAFRVMAKVLTVDRRPGRRFAARFSTGGTPLVRVTGRDLEQAHVRRVGRVVGVRDGQPLLDDGTSADAATVVWCTGFTHSYSWIQVPILASSGHPDHHRGVITTEPGLYFLGLPFQTGPASHLVGGVGGDADYICNHLEIVRWLGPGDLGWLIRTQYDSAATEGIDNRPGDRSRTLPLTAAGPTAAEATWNHYRTDSGHHAVYWIAEWPAMPVEAAWRYPLLALGGIHRTVTVTSEPVPPSRSLRDVLSQRVQKRADDAQRRRLGQVETAQDDEEYGALERRERELVRGHTEYRFTGWITVTGSTIEELEASCAQVEQAAVRSALEVRRIHGEVDQAFTVAAMPTAQGVRA